MEETNNLHIFELVNPALGVALPDLAQRLVLVTPLLDILLVDPVHGGLTRYSRESIPSRSVEIRLLTASQSPAWSHTTSARDSLPPEKISWTPKK